MQGRIHSFQSMGAVDGPGLRFIVFMQGCPLRCAYCHNPDTWDPAGGTLYTADEVVRRVLRYRSYFAEEGGVTVSGGEALMQSEFVAELFEKLHAHGIHTALDTSGIGDLQRAHAVLRHTDLVLCDIKFTDEAAYRKNSGGSLQAVLQFLKLCEQYDRPVWVRHVVVPGMTDSEAEIRMLVELACDYQNLQKIELLPFRKLCTAKYDTLNIPFALRDTPQCPNSTIEQLRRLIPAQYR